MRIIIVSLILNTISCCHYSCQTCFQGTSFVNCTLCPTGNITKMYDPDANQTMNFFYHRWTGVCGQPANEVLNYFGLILLTGVVVSAILTKRRQILRFASNVQNVALLSLVNVGMVSPMHYILQGLQFFLFFGKVTQQSKDMDPYIKRKGYYNVQTYAKSSDYVSNVLAMDIVIGLLGLTAFLLNFIDTLCISKISDTTKKVTWQKRIKKATIAMKYIFLYTMAEHFLYLTMSLAYGQIYPGGLMLGIFYLCLFIYFCVYTYYRPIGFFRARVLTYFNYLKKIVFPVLVVMPVHPVVLPILMIICIMAEVVYEWKVKGMSKAAIIYRLIECLTVLVLCGYILIENQGRTATGSMALGGICMAFLLIFSLVPFADVGLYLYEKYVEQRVASVSEEKTFVNRMITEENIGAVPMNETKLDMMNKSGLQEDEEVQPPRDPIYQFEEPEPQEFQEAVEVTAKKFKESETTLKSDPQLQDDLKKNVLEMMEVGGKHSPKKRRLKMSPTREKDLRVAYGIKD